MPNLQQVLTYNGLSLECPAGSLYPHLIGELGVVG